MDRFLHHKNPSAPADGTKDSSNKDNADLFSLLKAASSKQAQSSSSSSSTSSAELWDTKLSRNSVYSISDISMSNRIANNKKTLQGWKIQNGVRTYTTYRNGKLVSGEGAEAFKLSMGDAPKSKGKKRGQHENTNTIDNSTTMEKDMINESKENKLPKNHSMNSNNNNNSLHNRNNNNVNQNSQKNHNRNNSNNNISGSYDSNNMYKDNNNNESECDFGNIIGDDADFAFN